jgi:carboxyl-terminal processing protease
MTTFGKGSVQSILELPRGAGLRLTTARYYTPNGRSIQAEGVHPDVVIETPDPTGLSALELHERDLEGHLDAQPVGVPGTHVAPPGPARAVPFFRAPADAGAEEPPGPDNVEGSEARNVPVDPTKGKDFALHVAYQILRGERVVPDGAK